MSIYLSSPVSYYQRSVNTRIASSLAHVGINVSLPQDISPQKYSHKDFELYVYEKCLEMIRKSSAVLLVYPYGRDCAWEVGYYEALGLPQFAYLPNHSKECISRLRDWMIKGSLDVIFVTDHKMYNVINQDPILSECNIQLVLSEYEMGIYIQKHLSMNKPVTNFVGAGAIVCRSDKVLLIQEETSSIQYNRVKGMWGFPTETVNYFSPEQHALNGLYREAGYKGKDPKFITIQHIPRASGIFYKVELQRNQESKIGRWFPIRQILEEHMFLRPTYSTVLRESMRIN
jgi:nucleoside 2-deoxyribosyltransferase